VLNAKIITSYMKYNVSEIASVLTTPLLTKNKVIFAYTHIAFT